MPVYSPLLATDVKSLLTANYAKIESQSSGFKYNSEVIKTFTFSLVDLNDPFRLERFIEVLRPILTHFKINFSVDFILREEGELRYFHPSQNNSCLLSTALNISRDEDLSSFKTEFARGNWLDINTHLNLRPNTKAKVECIANITFYVYLLEGVYQFVGRPSSIMPAFFENSESLFTLRSNSNNKVYEDNLCFFSKCFLRS